MVHSQNQAFFPQKYFYFFVTVPVVATLTSIRDIWTILMGYYV